MQKKPKRPLVVTAERIKALTQQDLRKVEGGDHIPPKFGTCRILSDES